MTIGGSESIFSKLCLSQGREHDISKMPADLPASSVLLSLIRLLPHAGEER